MSVKYVPSTIAIGPEGPYVTRGYTDFGNGLRIYEDQLVVGKHGQYETSPGWCEVGQRDGGRYVHEHHGAGR
jgi:hypothetical protein